METLESIPRNSSKTSFHSYEKYRDTGTPLVVDNGSWQIRAGWSGEEEPNLCFTNVICKYKDKVTGELNLNVGEEALNVGQTAVCKVPFDSGVFVNSEVFETVLCYAFCKLGIDQDAINHPILMTENLCNTLYSRKIMSELLFEAYGIPSVTYGIDSLFSFYYNNPNNKYGVVVSAGNNYTSVIPVCDGKGQVYNSQKISFGGSQASEYMLNLVKYKYPNFPHKLDINYSQFFIKNHCYVSLNYEEDLKKLEGASNVREQESVIQFPFTLAKSKPPISAEDMELIAASRREQAAKMREERFKAKRRMLEAFKELKKEKKRMLKADYLETLQNHDFESEADLENEIKALEASIYKAENKLSANPEQSDSKKPASNLTNISDENLTEEQKKEKRKQKLLLSSWEARERIKREKQAEKEHEIQMSQQDEELRLKNPEVWLQNLRDKRQKILERVVTKQRKKAQLSDRRSRESQLRMKSIATLAEGESVSKRRRGADKEVEDTFGVNDDDWMVYKQISKSNDSSGEEDMINLGKTEELLMTHDPTFVMEDVLEAGNMFKNTVMYRLAWDPQKDAFDAAHMNQIRLNVERIRVPEVLFRPSITGIDQAGLSELILNIVTGFDSPTQDLMCKNIFVTGGFCQFKNILKRIENGLISERPFGSELNIKMAKDPSLDAWKGASRWVTLEPEEFARAGISKSAYDEMGHDYLIEHRFGNTWWAHDQPSK